jgi:hypothetical protein
MALTLAVLLALAAASIGLFFALGRGPARALEITPERAYLEPVFVGESRPFEIQLKNVSSDLVEFRGIMAGCACLNVGIAAPRLEPGESTLLTGTLRGRGRAGTFHDEVLVVAAGAQEEGYKIPIHWEVKRRIEVSAEALTLQPDFVSAAPGTGTVVVRNASEQAIDLSDPKPLPVGIKAVAESRRLSPGQSTTIRFSAEPTLVTPGKFNLSFPCSHPSERALEFQLDVQPVGGIRVTPATVNWGVLAKRELLARTVALSLEGELVGSCDVKELKLPAYLVSAGAPQSPAPTKREFSFRVKDAFAGGADLKGEVVIVLRHRPSGRSFNVQVPLSGFVLDARSG